VVFLLIQLPDKKHNTKGQSQMKTILQVTAASILLLSLTNNTLANKPNFKDLQFLENGWYKLTFPPYNMSTGVQVFETRDDYLEGYDKRKDLGLLRIPSKLKQVIFSKNTINPFRALFPYIYTTQNQKTMKHCGNFTGIQIELDDNSETTEWYIVAPVETCLRDKDHYIKHPIMFNPSEVGHVWIIQKSQSRQYRILMESEGSTDISNKKHQGYKHLITQVYNNHIYRQKVKKDSNKYCGKAWISWKYESGNYQPTRVGGSASNCKYHSEEHKNILVKKIVTPLVLRWLNIKTPEPITINEKKEVIPANSVKNTQSSFNQDELNTINNLLH